MKLIDAMNGYLYFVTIVEQGSLTKAAKHLAVPKSKLSRRLALLEQQLGSELLIRTTRKQQLSESGLLLYQACKPHVEALSAMEALVNDNQIKVKGKLKILLPLEFFNKIISALITEFAVLYPDVQIHCHHYSTPYPDFDHQYDLVFVLHEEPLPMSSWIGKTLLSFPQSIYCALDNELLNTNEIKNIENYRVILSSEHEQWFFRDKENIQVVSGGIAMILSSAEMRIEACQRAIGLVKLPDYIAKNNEKIRAVTFHRQVVAQQLTILYQSRNVPAKTRVFLDYFQSNIGCLSE